jgi:hypothetical protein
MFPKPPEKILQDTKNVRRSLVMDTNIQKLIALMLIGVIVLGLMSFTKYASPKIEPPKEKAVQASEPTPLPQTNTFVDKLVGTIVYLRDGKLFEYQLPDRKEKQIVGLRPSEEIQHFIRQRPAWSQTGRFLGVMVDASHVYVSEYDTGKFVGSFALRSPLRENQEIVLSFDPADEVLSIGVDSKTGIVEESALFYTLLSQKELGFYPHCSARGSWLSGVGYVLRCQLADAASLNLIRFDPSSSTMIPLTPERNGLRYQIIGEYAEKHILALRTINGREDLVSISRIGKVESISTATLPKGVTPAQVANPRVSLMRRIESTLYVTGVVNVSVSTDSDWLIYETAEGLFLNTLSLKEPSFFIGKGSLPVIRPS